MLPIGELESRLEDVRAYLDNIGEYMCVKCKNPHCNRPAWHNGFCFMCWKHENYEVK